MLFSGFPGMAFAPVLTKAIHLQLGESLTESKTTTTPVKTRSYSMLSASVLIALALSSAANAAFISGLISFDGHTTLDNTNLALTTKVVTWSGVEAGPPITGDFVAFVSDHTPAVFTDGWVFTSGSLTPLWTCGGFSFDLVSSAVQYQTSQSLVVNGTGTVRGNGFDPTFGTWDFSSQTGSGTAFRFSASSAVPDGGTTMALFGFSLLGLYGVRRKIGTR